MRRVGRGRSGGELEELHALLEFPAEEIAAQLEAEAEEQEKVLPRVMSFVVSGPPSPP